MNGNRDWLFHPNIDTPFANTAEMVGALLSSNMGDPFYQVYVQRRINQMGGRKKPRVPTQAEQFDASIQAITDDYNRTNPQ